MAFYVLILHRLHGVHIIQGRSGRIVSNQVNEHPVPVEQIEW